MLKLRIVLALVSVLLLQAAPASPSDKTTGLLDLVGVWQLDGRVSEDPIRMLRDARGRYSGSPPRGGRKDRAEAAPPVTMEERLAEFTEGEEVLTITYAEPQLTVTYWDDHQRVLRVDGKKVDQERAGGTVRVKANWGSSDRLVVKTEGAPEGKVVEIFEIGERGDKLFVYVELYVSGSKTPFRFQRLYNRLTPQE